MPTHLPPIPGRSAPPMPQPDSDAQQHSEHLISAIKEQIDGAGGSISFERYMELALYAPGLGYYAAGARKFGEEGDFVTAPESSPLFARCLARQCLQVLSELGEGDVMEVGAGSGIMAADLLLELEQLGTLPGRYLILELSPELQHRQRQTIEQKASHLLPKVSWISAMPEPGFCGVVVANELLDAMPVNRFRIDDGALSEQRVRWSEDKFEVYWDSQLSDGLEQGVAPVLAQLGDEGHDFESEVNLKIKPWIAALSDSLFRGAVMLIDYGYPRSEFYHPQRSRGTLMCHYRHRAHEDPFVYPGLQDITAHVDFTAVAEAGVAAGFSVAGYTTQAYFLMANGLDQLVASSDPNDVAVHMRLVSGVKRLTLPSEMGERFKVIGLTKGIASSLQGFAMRDMSERL